MINEDIDDLLISTEISDKKKLSEFLRFREIQVWNLITFKERPEFRKKVLPLILDEENSFTSIIPQYKGSFPVWNTACKIGL